MPREIGDRHFLWHRFRTGATARSGVTTRASGTFAGDPQPDGGQFDVSPQSRRSDRHLVDDPQLAEILRYWFLGHRILWHRFQTGATRTSATRSRADAEQQPPALALRLDRDAVQ